MLTLSLIVILGWEIAVSSVSLDPDELEPRDVASLDVRDQGGTRLRQEMSRAGYRETWVKLSQISPHLIHATLASEDHDFYLHHGVDWWAMARATLLNLRSGRFAFGGSTLTMQLARLVKHLPRTLRGKFTQILTAARLERELNKASVLEHYLNRVYYGNGAWGAEQAALLYFGKPARELALGEASALAVIPRGPSYYDPFKRWTRLMERRAKILSLMALREYITPEDVEVTLRAPLRLRPSERHFRAPHFVEMVKERLPPQLRRGARVQTTLDWPLQRRIEVAVRRHVDQLHWRKLRQASVVVIRNSDGAVLALVGSRDYSDHRYHGAFNGVTAQLRPGSTLKPFVYGTAIERGDSPASIALDVISPHEVNQFYTKDVRSHGFARYRESLAGSYNLSAVHTLQRVGVKSVLDKLRTSGIWTLDEPDDDYDWGLAIGHARVRLLELAAAFSVFGRGGSAIKPRVILNAEGVDGSSFSEPIHEHPSVFSPAVAYLIFDILSDPDARRPMFGDSVPLHLPFKVALKTGTTKAYTDLWALGTTREYTVGVWAGNFEGEPTARVKSVRGATPLLRAVYTALASRFENPSAPSRPQEVIESTICPLSGLARGPHCPHQMTELFLAGMAPQHPCDWHQRICDEVMVVYPPELRAWAEAANLNPQRSCHNLEHRESNLELDSLLPESARAPAGAAPEYLRITRPVSGARFVLEAHRPARSQRPSVRVSPVWVSADAVWTVNGTPLAEWTPHPGEHRVEVRVGALHDAVQISYVE